MNRKKPDIVKPIYRYKPSKVKNDVGWLRRRLGARGYAFNLPLNERLVGTYIV